MVLKMYLPGTNKVLNRRLVECEKSAVDGEVNGERNI